MPYQLLKNARLHLEITKIMKNGLVSCFHGKYCCHADRKRLDWCYQTGNGKLYILFSKARPVSRSVSECSRYSKTFCFISYLLNVNVIIKKCSVWLIFVKAKSKYCEQYESLKKEGIHQSLMDNKKINYNNVCVSIYI